MNEQKKKGLGVFFYLFIIEKKKRMSTYRHSFQMPTEGRPPMNYLGTTFTRKHSSYCSPTQGMGNYPCGQYGVVTNCPSGGQLELMGEWNTIHAVSYNTVHDPHIADRSNIDFMPRLLSQVPFNRRPAQAYAGSSLVPYSMQGWQDKSVFNAYYRLVNEIS